MGLLSTFSLLRQASPRDLYGLQVKLTHVGSQTKAIPTIAFATFHTTIQMALFNSLRTPGLSYENDEHDVWSFTVLPEEMVRIVTALSGLDEVRALVADVDAQLSLAFAMPESRLGQVGFEVVLDPSGAAAALAAIAAALDERNGVGRFVLDLRRQM